MWLTNFPFILFPLLFWTESLCNEENEWARIVDNYISQVAPLAISSSDPLNDMAMLSANASKFASITVAVMKIIVDSIRNNDSEPSLNGMETLQKLHNYTTAQFEKIDKLLRAKEQTIGDSVATKDFFYKVEFPMRIILHNVEWVTNPIFRSRIHTTEVFDHQCSGFDYSPRNILLWFEMHFVEYCRLMSRQQIGLFAAASMAFGPLDQIVENRFTPPEVHDYFIDRADYLYRMIKRKEEYQTNEELVNRLEQQVNEISMLNGQAFKNGIFQLLNSAPYRITRELYFYCTLDAVLVRHQFKRDRILDLVEFVRLEMIRLMSIIPLCITVRPNIEPLTINTFTEGMAERIVKIAKHVHEWAVFYLEESWPEMMINVAQNVARKHELTAYTSWNQTAREISTALNKLGPDGYNHQVLLTPPWDSVKWFHAKLHPNYGFQVIKFNDLVNIVVVRHNRDAIQMQTLNRLKNAREIAVNGHIAMQIFDDNWNSDDMAHVLGTINNNTAGLYGPHNFHASILIHNSKWLKGDCQILTGHSDEYLNDTLTYNYIHYHENGYFKGCQDFKLFQLL